MVIAHLHRPSMRQTKRTIKSGGVQFIDYTILPLGNYLHICNSYYIARNYIQVFFDRSLPLQSRKAVSLRTLRSSLELAAGERKTYHTKVERPHVKPKLAPLDRPKRFTHNHPSRSHLLLRWHSEQARPHSIQLEDEGRKPRRKPQPGTQWSRLCFASRRP